MPEGTPVVGTYMTRMDVGVAPEYLQTQRTAFSGAVRTLQPLHRQCAAQQQRQPLQPLQYGMVWLQSKSTPWHGGSRAHLQSVA